uniref:Striatin n=1 Tax=Oncorhynchus kisutch TaxID=8019 RepID=A0A8C7IC96_ONCKI
MDEQAGPGVFFNNNNNSILAGVGKVLLPEGDAGEADRSPYSIPGILHFLQHEWARFEVDRAQWEVDRAELQAQTAFLQGERKGQENLKKDLVRRIKMLEYVLKQERAKYHKLKYGTELNQGDMKPPSYDSDEVNENDAPGSLNNQLSWKQGRQLLRQYLQEVGYTDTILDVKAQRVQTLLAMAGGGRPGERTGPETPLVNGTGTVPKGTDTGGGKTEVSESSVVPDTFRFYCDEDDDEDGTGLDRTVMEQTGPTGTMVRKKPPSSSSPALNMDTSEDPDAEDALKGFDFLSSPDNMDTSPESRSAGLITKLKEEQSAMSEAWDVDQGLITKRRRSTGRSARGRRGERVSYLSSSLNFSSLSASSPLLPVLISSSSPPCPRILPVLYISSPPRPHLLSSPSSSPLLPRPHLLSSPMSNNKDALRRTWNPKLTLRSHFDGVRGLAFHPIEPVLVTASEDHTLKMWNLQKTAPAKKNASVDVEPMYTFRAHQGAVLCVVMSSTGEQCFSGGLDGTIQSWNTPNPNLDPYDSYEPSVLRGALCGHTDSVWGLVYSGVHRRLLSCSGDGTVKLWDASDTKPALVTFQNKEFGVPSSVDLLCSDPAHMVTSFTSGRIGLFNMETQQLVLSLESAAETGTRCQINKVLSHPTLPITITAEEDRHIKFFDNNTGKLIHSMVAHLDAVTSLAVDPNGLYLMSGSHDCSIRLWNLETKTCIQEFTAHRKKNDESIHDVAFHPSKAYIASAGADALAKVFV